ncbi:MAG: hypothetical protein JW772_05530 [Candidatus Diapherotrites archaeon]|nr:hypothetical protein [Candidatus Diapherotrites archaeon]
MNKNHIIMAMALFLVILSLGCIDPVTICTDAANNGYPADDQGNIVVRTCAPPQSEWLRMATELLGQEVPANSAAVNFVCQPGNIFTAWFPSGNIADCEYGCFIPSAGDDVSCIGEQPTLVVNVVSVENALLEGATVEIFDETKENPLYTGTTLADGRMPAATLEMPENQLTMFVYVRASAPGYETTWANSAVELRNGTPGSTTVVLQPA